MKDSIEKTTIGWREWISLPELGVEALKVKVDTGARTSALHAFEVKTFEEEGRRKVRFGIHPLQKRKDIEVFCVADVVDERVVSDSGGHREKRIVIRTPVKMGGQCRDVEFTLTDRETMLFRALLGRTAMNDIVVDSARSYMTGTAIKEKYLKKLEGSI